MTALATDNFREQLLGRRYEPSVAAVNELCDSLRAAKPGTDVPYVDPMHDVDECRIISLYSNIGTADASGFITAGDEEAATRMLGVQWKLGLRP
ncbi:MAG TPA: uracil-DNA glycosylase, partial [Arthrobacter sp.]|nr:uracil-DNA glycosylase [Arthrobacter sp.]